MLFFVTYLIVLTSAAYLFLLFASSLALNSFDCLVLSRSILFCFLLPSLYCEALCGTASVWRCYISSLYVLLLVWHHHLLTVTCATSQKRWIMNQVTTWKMKQNQISDVCSCRRHLHVIKHRLQFTVTICATLLPSSSIECFLSNFPRLKINFLDELLR